MAHDVFISYASQDKTIADAVCAGLEKEGVRCWIAPRDILTSENYDDAIIKAISSARIMVVIFSSNIFQSQFVKSEVERGFSKGLIIAPFRIENVAPEGGLELYLGRRHWLDAMTPPLEAHIQTLASTVRSMLAVQPAAPDTASAGQPQNPVRPAPPVHTPPDILQRLGLRKPGRSTGLIAATAGGIGLLGVLCVVVVVFVLVKNWPTRLQQPGVFVPTNQGEIGSSPAAPEGKTTQVSNAGSPLTSTPAAAGTDPTTVSPDSPGLSAASWRSLGDLPRTVNSFLVDPADPNIVYAATGDYTGAGAGVYKSTDAGLSWKSIPAGLPNQSVTALGMIEGASPVLLAAFDHSADLYSSADGGASWARLSSISGGGGATVQTFVCSPDSQRVYALASGQGLLVSENSGQTWTPLGEGLPKDENWGQLVLSIAADPSDANILYIGTGGFVGQGQGVFKSTDGGESFAPANQGMLDYRITALAVDPNQPQVVYAGSDNGDLFKSSDSGQSWTNLKERLDMNLGSQVRSIQIDPASGRLYLLGDFKGLLTSEDGGERWRPVGTPPGTDQPQFSSLAVIFGEQPVVLTATSGVTQAGGWRIGEGQPTGGAAPAQAVDTGMPEKTISLSGSWQLLDDLPHQVNAVTIDPTDPNRLFAGAGSTGQSGALYQSLDGGLSWAALSPGLNNQAVLGLGFSAGPAPILYAAAGASADVYTSQDQGQSWSAAMQTGLFGTFETHFFTAPSDNAVVYLAANPGGVLRSTNQGQTWMPLGEGLPMDGNRGALVLSVAIDPSNPQVVYAGTGGFVGQGQGVFKSTDGGESFAPANQGMLDYRITALAVDPNQPQVVYAGSDNGDLFKSSDGGQSWTNLKDRLILRQYGEPRQIRELRIDPASGIIYLLGDNSGLLYSGNGGAKWRMVGNPPGTEQPRYICMDILFGETPTFFLGIMDEGGVWRFGPTP